MELLDNSLTTLRMHLNFEFTFYRFFNSRLMRQFFIEIEAAVYKNWLTFKSYKYVLLVNK